MNQRSAWIPTDNVGRKPLCAGGRALSASEIRSIESVIAGLGSIRTSIDCAPATVAAVVYRLASAGITCARRGGRNAIRNHYPTRGGRAHLRIVQGVRVPTRSRSVVDISIGKRAGI